MRQQSLVTIGAFGFEMQCYGLAVHARGGEALRLARQRLRRDGTGLVVPATVRGRIDFRRVDAEKPHLAAIHEHEAVAVERAAYLYDLGGRGNRWRAPVGRREKREAENKKGAHPERLSA